MTFTISLLLVFLLFCFYCSLSFIITPQRYRFIRLHRVTALWMSVSSRAGSQTTNPPVHFSPTLQNCECVYAFVRIWNSYFVMSLVLLTHFQSLGDVSSVQLAGMFELSFFSQFCFAGRQAFRLFVLFSLLDLDSQFSVFSNHRFWAGDWHSCSIPQAVTVVMLTALGPAPCARLSFVTIHQGRVFCTPRLFFFLSDFYDTVKAWEAIRIEAWVGPEPTPKPSVLLKL